MYIQVKWKNGAGQKTFTVIEETETAVWKVIGQVLLELKRLIPNEIKIETSKGDAYLIVKARGSYIENGEKLPSMYVTVKYNNIDLPKSDYAESYLTCLHTESNNYKFYWLKPNNAYHELSVTYGRIGEDTSKTIKVPYESYLYWIRYYEKLSKGYVDQTDIYLNKTQKAIRTHKNSNDKGKATTKQELGNIKATKELSNLLESYAKNYVRMNLLQQNITYTQVQEAKKVYRQLVTRKTVRGFNSQLEKLLQLSPRRVTNVSELIASSEADFSKIVQRESTLIQAMESVLQGGTQNGLQGIEVYYATAEQKEEVLSKLSDVLKPKVKAVYRIINHRHKNRFNAYVKDENIKVIKQLWHGSRNCNWLSILVNGLLLNPDAQITGKMFGDGIYFAPNSLKSWNYTSYRGTYWANGTDDLAIMGLYAVAYGQPHVVQVAGNWNQEKLKAIHKDCVHAKAGAYLKNDEIIFYSESSILLNYIVVFQ